ncbi:hypothetical protein ACWF7H_20020 [Peribacillus butanolivorans]
MTEAFITHIEERNKSLNVFVYFGYEDALKKAKEAERSLLAGEEIDSLSGWSMTYILILRVTLLHRSLHGLQTNFPLECKLSGNGIQIPML